MRLIILSTLILSTFSAFAQNMTGKVWDLQTCIDAAIKNSLDVQQSMLSVEQNELGFKQSKYNRLPDLNGSGGLYFQAGRSTDRFTNTNVTNNVTQNNYQLNSTLVLFAGGQLNNNIKYNKYNWMASEYDLINVEQNISLNVANLFLQVAQARELKKSYEQNLKNTTAQLDKAQKQFDAGVINEGNLLNMKAQEATDLSNIVTAENQERTALTSLKLLLRLPFEDKLDIEIPLTGSIIPQVYPDSLTVIFDSAMTKRTDVKASEMRLKAYMFRKKSIMGALLPSLTAAANLSTLYSSNAKTYLNPHYDEWQTTGRVVGQAVPNVETPKWLYDVNTINYGTQMKNNIGNWVGASLAVPIFTKFQNSTNVKVANLDVERYRIAYERSKQNLYNEVVTAYNSFLSAMNRLKASKLSLESQNKNLDFVQKRFDAGQAAAIDLQISKATQAAAQVSLLSVQYEYIFRRMVLDFYMGQKLELK